MANNQRTSDEGLAFLVAHEGVVPAPYWDSADPPVLTFGIGHTAAAGPPDPAKMPRGMPTDLDAGLMEAFRVFRNDLPKYEAGVRAVLKGKTVPQHQFDAAVSFHYNTGAIGRASWVKNWVAGDIKGAAHSMISNWRRPASIIPRREAERDLFLHGRYGNKTAAVWPVNASGRIQWKPVRTLTQAQIVAMTRPKPAPPPPKPSAPVMPSPVPPPAPAGPDLETWAIGALVAAAIAAFFILGG